MFRAEPSVAATGPAAATGAAAPMSDSNKGTAPAIVRVYPPMSSPGRDNGHRRSADSGCRPLSGRYRFLISGLSAAQKHLSDNPRQDVLISFRDESSVLLCHAFMVMTIR